MLANLLKLSLHLLILKLQVSPVKSNDHYHNLLMQANNYKPPVALRDPSRALDSSFRATIHLQKATRLWKDYCAHYTLSLWV